MILVDTSVWVEYLRHGNPALERALDAGKILAHPWVSGELALGGVSDHVLDLLARLPAAVVATDDEVHTLIARWQLARSGIGWVDAALLASVQLTADAELLTADRKLAAVAAR